MRDKDFNTELRGGLFEAQHYDRMGVAVWLDARLILRQTRQEGTLGFVLGGKPLTYRDIEEETGFGRKTLERWMRVLRCEGYIETQVVPSGTIVKIRHAWGHRGHGMGGSSARSGKGQTVVRRAGT